MTQSYQALIDQVGAAADAGRPLNISGGGSKTFYGEAASGETLSSDSLQGVVEYDPAELVMVVRAGTPLLEVQTVLAEQGQMLGFEPPFAAQGASIGGAVASGLSGSARAYRGAVRDYLLGTRIINGRAQELQFGGRVMKNVAGFDLFRPMAGALGTLGVLLEVSLRLIPVPEQTLSLTFAAESRPDAIKVLCALGQSLACLSAAAWHQGEIILRLSGSELAIKRDRAQLSADHDISEMKTDIWPTIAEYSHNFFSDPEGEQLLVAIDLPPATRDIELPGEQLIDWGGARRYLKTPLALETVRSAIAQMGGTANLLNRNGRGVFFHPLNPALMAVHRRLKASFDPQSILNPGRLFPEL